ncbi:glycosyltransferase [Rossellomorea aquimaris]|uniref:glycosyltransferase n=1 Tax=Rossellomorea aquimaris TaxID=189382 RepID=UPI0007D04EBF|nr:glycosyltransferase family 2 protein [Rossellomorea aquimaris]
MFIWLSAFVFTVLLFTRISSVRKTIHVQNSYLVKKCSIIIPARNEQENIEKLLTSIKNQLIQPLEVIVVDDSSTDHTKEIALLNGARVVDNPPLPIGWNGKSWACWNGVKASEGEMLLFVDADTWFETTGLLRICETFKNQLNQGFLSIHPYHKMKDGYETFSMFFHLIIFASTGITHFLSLFFTPSGGFGQCMLCSRSAYYRVGGHYAIKEHMVEHFALMKRAKKLGEPVEAASGKGAILMRMYSMGFKDLIHGWSKSIASGAKTTNVMLFLLTSIWISLMTSFVIHFPTLLWTDTYVFLFQYLLLSSYLYFVLRRIGNFSFFDTLLFPLHLLFFIFTFTYSFIQRFITKKVMWKDRYVLVEKGKDEKMK